ncbi:MAG: hypothetical protein NT067_04340 [Candidatus Diapherotrites archaeon]|nr:hypothetical protein [Candidatus Diapherotrites archaeon]
MASAKEQFMVVFFISIMLSSQIAYAAETGSSLGVSRLEGNGRSVVSLEDDESPASSALASDFTCSSSSMSDSDSQKFLDLLRDGFLGATESSGSAADTAREKLANPTIIIPMGDDKNNALKVDMADQKFDANEAQHIFNDHIKGPYSYGIVLTDTLRVGRCVDLKDNNIACPMEGKQLSLRNSGTGFKSDFKPIGQFINDAWAKYLKNPIVGAAEKVGETVTGKDLNWTQKEQEDWTDEDYEGMRKSMGLPANSAEALKETAASSDINETQVMTMSRLVKDMIANSILTSSFSAYSQTTCNTTDCIINVYSLFDKYYNNWFSTDMVVSAGLPTLVSRAKKLFLNLGRRGLIPKIKKVIDEKVFDAFRRKFLGPGSKYYKRLGDKMWALSESTPEVGRLRNYLTESTTWTDGMLMVKSREFRNKLENEWMTQGGWFDQIKEGRIQKDMYKFAKDMEQWQKIQRATYNAAKQPYMETLKQFGLGHNAEVAARIDFGQKISNLATSSESLLHLDIPEWISRDGSTRLYYYAVKPQGSDATRWLADDSINIYKVMEKFSKDGQFGGSWANVGSAGFESTGANLNLYAFDKSAEKIGEVTADELKTHFSHFTDLFTQTDAGDVMPIKDATLPYVSKVMTGKKPLFKQANNLNKVAELSPAEFAQRLTNNRRLESYFDWYGPDNAEKLVYGLQAKGFAKRAYTSLLDRAMMNQDELLKNYFGTKTGPFKWTGLFNAYWFAKKGGGNEALSGYMLPESWREVRWPLGSDPLYNDAFIDFFAHEGSDQGDKNSMRLQKIFIKASQAAT